MRHRQLLQEALHLRRAAVGVLTDEPVQARHVHQRLRQACQLRHLAEWEAITSNRLQF